MQINEVGEFNKILDTVATVFGKKLTEDVKRAYFDALKDVPLSVIRQCAAAHVANGKYFPKPAELKPKFAPSAQEASDSKFPPLYSPEWWEGRVQVLKQTAPNGLSAQSRNSLNEATFGKDDSPKLRAQAREAYCKAWPWLADEINSEHNWLDAQLAYQRATI